MVDAPGPLRVTAESKINDVLARHPSTGPIFTQGRRLYVDQLNDLYARFPGLTVGDFARQNVMELGPLLTQLNAMAESEDAARPTTARAHGGDESPTGHFSLTLGYTASYRPREDSTPDSVSVVTVQSSRGPQ